MSAAGAHAVGDCVEGAPGVVGGVPRLDFAEVTGGYGGVRVVRGISGAVAPGEVLCVIGRNGVGKSTLLKLLTGQLRLASGRVRLDGRAIEDVEASRRRALGMAYCPQERPVFDDLSVRDNLTLMRVHRRIAVFEPLLRALPDPRAPARPACGHAVGRREEDPLVRARPRGGRAAAAARRAERRRAVGEHPAHGRRCSGRRRTRGASFVVVEQNLAFAERIADRYLVVEQGRVALEGPREAIDRARLLAHLHV